MPCFEKRWKLLVGVILLALLAVFSVMLNSHSCRGFPERLTDYCAYGQRAGSYPEAWICIKGYAPRILMVENWESGYALLESHGVRCRRMRDRGHGGDSVRVRKRPLLFYRGCRVPGGSPDISRYLQDNPEIDKILLVSSKYHSRRSAIIFRWVIGDTEILSCPTPYDNYNADSWWRTRQDAKSVVIEYAKLANFYLLYRWR